MEFDHNAQTSFALLGMHQSVPCTGCHVDLVFSKAPTQCSECHADLHRRQFGANCQQCHTVQGWNVQVSAIQGHDNRFPLLGAHAAVICDQCHRGAASGVFTGLSTQCVSCHQRDFQTATPLNHVAAGLPTTCEACHNMNSWPQTTRFDHAQFAHFALTGAHASLQCQQCHVGNRYAGTPAACIGCHMNDYTGAKAPDHVAGSFPQDCAGCHTTTTWLSAKFDHNTTGFALTGAHNSLQCSQCHNAQFGNYNIPSGACANCHMADYNGTTNPSHKTAGFPTTCEGCHATTTWTTATAFNHQAAGFPLTNAHATLQCTDCHNSQFGNYSIPNGACAQCHMKDYNGTTSPPHQAAQIPTTCDSCHTTVAGWGGATFNHATTGFALVGAHATQLCTACHINNNYTLNSTACITCHLADFNGANNPPHTGFPTDCTTCHGTAIANWTSATFNHATTGFALTGAHTNAACTLCHVNNNYSLTSGACWNCHAMDYNSTNNPPHAAQSFPQDCSGCHTTTDWTSGTFNHATTGFALTGAHTTQLCSACHVNNNYSLTSAACWNCHQADYNGTNSPAHLASGFPQDCSICHSTTNWTTSAFDHNTTGFALTGAHATQLCSACHVGNNYSLGPADTACIKCHLKDWNNTTNPGHAAAGFAQTCDSCHSFTDWTGAQYLAHDTKDFPIYSGRHLGLWHNCTDCHTSSTNYSTTTLTCYSGTCHPKSEMDTSHALHMVTGYVYNAPNCYSCHPKGLS
jgi:hypothetical protein